MDSFTVSFTADPSQLRTLLKVLAWMTVCQQQNIDSAFSIWFHGNRDAKIFCKFSDSEPFALYRQFLNEYQTDVSNNTTLIAFEFGTSDLAALLETVDIPPFPNS